MGQELKARYAQVRQRSLELVAPLQPEDVCLQGMADASPPKWHLGHTTWFFEQFVLRSPVSPDAWGFLFNSYYDSVGARHPRPQRGLLSRPALAEVRTWRQRLDGALLSLLEQLEPGDPRLELVELGLQHEQQHQELLLMDLLDGFSRNPLEPAYGQEPPGAEASEVAGGWRSHPGGLVEIGHEGGGFHFDNEAPRHRQWLEPFLLAETLVSNGDYAAFIADGGYRRAELWMSEGWAVVQERGWCAPRYWRGEWEFGLAGRRPRHPQAPVRHLSWFEADAFARWSGGRLPSEAEWELVVAQAAQPGGRPLPQAYAALWQWTASPYRPYPGFRAAPGAVGEYNGKFMTSQFVLRGSSFLTPAGHARPTYRNFFAPHCRWMAAGLRLARDGTTAPC